MDPKLFSKKKKEQPQLDFLRAPNLGFSLSQKKKEDLGLA